MTTTTTAATLLSTRFITTFYFSLPFVVRSAHSHLLLPALTHKKAGYVHKYNMPKNANSKNSIWFVSLRFRRAAAASYFAISFHISHYIVIVSPQWCHGLPSPYHRHHQQHQWHQPKNTMQMELYFFFIVFFSLSYLFLRCSRFVCVALRVIISKQFGSSPLIHVFESSPHMGMQSFTLAHSRSIRWMCTRCVSSLFRWLDPVHEYNKWIDKRNRRCDVVVGPLKQQLHFVPCKLVQQCVPVDVVYMCSGTIEHELLLYYYHRCIFYLCVELKQSTATVGWICQIANDDFTSLIFIFFFCAFSYDIRLHNAHWMFVFVNLFLSRFWVETTPTSLHVWVWLCWMSFDVVWCKNKCIHAHNQRHTETHNFPFSALVDASTYTTWWRRLDKWSFATHFAQCSVQRPIPVSSLLLRFAARPFVTVCVCPVSTVEVGKCPTLIQWFCDGLSDCGPYLKMESPRRTDIMTMCLMRDELRMSVSVRVATGWRRI